MMPSYYVTASIKLCPEVGNHEYIILRNFNGRSMSSLLHYKRVFPSVYWFLYPDANKALENQVNANVAVGEVCSVIRLFYGALNYLGMFWIHAYAIKCAEKADFWCRWRARNVRSTCKKSRSTSWILKPNLSIIFQSKFCVLGPLLRPPDDK